MGVRPRDGLLAAPIMVLLLALAVGTSEGLSRLSIGGCRYYSSRIARILLLFCCGLLVEGARRGFAKPACPSLRAQILVQVVKQEELRSQR